MQFVIVGRDGADDEAATRRAAVRAKHIEMGEELRQAGHLWFGAALLDAGGTMNGSMYLVDFDTREDLDKWLRAEPYVVGDVWRSLDVYDASVRDPWQFTQPQSFYEGRTSHLS